MYNATEPSPEPDPEPEPEPEPECEQVKNYDQLKQALSNLIEDKCIICTTSKIEFSKLLDINRAASVFQTEESSEDNQLTVTIKGKEGKTIFDGNGHQLFFVGGGANGVWQRDDLYEKLDIVQGSLSLPELCYDDAENCMSLVNQDSDETDEFCDCKDIEVVESKEECDCVKYCMPAQPLTGNVHVVFKDIIFKNAANRLPQSNIFGNDDICSSVTVWGAGAVTSSTNTLVSFCNCVFEDNLYLYPKDNLRLIDKNNDTKYRGQRGSISMGAIIGVWGPRYNRNALGTTIKYKNGEYNDEDSIKNTENVILWAGKPDENANDNVVFEGQAASKKLHNDKEKWTTFPPVNPNCSGHKNFTGGLLPRDDDEYNDLTDTILKKLNNSDDTRLNTRRQGVEFKGCKFRTTKAFREKYPDNVEDPTYSINSIALQSEFDLPSDNMENWTYAGWKKVINNRDIKKSNFLYCELQDKNILDKFEQATSGMYIYNSNPYNQPAWAQNIGPWFEYIPVSEPEPEPESNSDSSTQNIINN